MPFTPFHLPPNALAGFAARGRLDVPVLLVVNLAMDIEPLVVTVLDLGPPPHGFVHTLLGALVVGPVTGWLFWRGRGALEAVFGGEYPLRARVAVVSGVVGAAIHVALDAVMYSHIRPFFPLAANPLHVPGSDDALHLVTALLLLPVAALVVRLRYWRTVAQKTTVALLVLSAFGMAVSVGAGAV